MTGIDKVVVLPAKVQVQGTCSDEFTPVRAAFTQLSTPWSSPISAKSISMPLWRSTGRNSPQRGSATSGWVNYSVTVDAER
jgi:hypothetical protein